MFAYSFDAFFSLYPPPSHRPTVYFIRSISVYVLYIFAVFYLRELCGSTTQYINRPMLNLRIKYTNKYAASKRCIALNRIENKIFCSEKRYMISKSISVTRFRAAKHSRASERLRIEHKKNTAYVNEFLVAGLGLYDQKATPNLYSIEYANYVFHTEIA